MGYNGNRITYEQMKNLAIEKQGELLSDPSECKMGGESLVQWKCKNNHIFRMRYSDIKSNHRWCPQCMIINTFAKKPYPQHQRC